MESEGKIAKDLGVKQDPELFEKEVLVPRDTLKLPEELLTASREDLIPILEEINHRGHDIFLNYQKLFKKRDLFVETTRENTVSKPFYWLSFPSKSYREKYEKYKHLPSFRECFIKFGDISGKVFANYFLAGEEHLNYLLEEPWFSAYFKGLQNELYFSIRTFALKNLIRIAYDKNHKNNYQALSYLSSGAWAKDLYDPNAFYKLTPKEKEDLGKQIKEELNKLIEDHSRLFKEDTEVVGTA